MGYSDIDAWAKSMNEELEEARAWDEACDRAEEARKAKEAEDFEALEEKEIDPATLGMTASEAGEIEEAEAAEESDVIDFAAYGVAGERVDEADMREPLTAASAALGAPASTANLAAQDTVKLAEAIEALASAVRESGALKKKITESEAPDPEAVKELAALLASVKDEGGAPLTDEDWAYVEDLPEDTREQVLAKIAYVEGRLKSGAGSLDLATRRRLFNFGTELRELAKDLGRREEADERAKAAFEEAAKIQDLSFERPLRPEEYKRFKELLCDEMDGECRAQLLARNFQISRSLGAPGFGPSTGSRETVTLTPDMAAYNRNGVGSGYQVSPGTEYGASENNLVSQHVGAARIFKANPEAREWTKMPYDQDPLVPKQGKAEFPTQFNPGFKGSVRYRQDVEDLWRDMQRSGMDQAIRDYWLAAPADEGSQPGDWTGGRRDTSLSDEDVAALQAAVEDPWNEGELPARDFIAFLNTLSKNTRDALKAELLADAGADPDRDPEDVRLERAMIEKIFDGSILTLNQRELAHLRGYGTGAPSRVDGKKNQGTGGITQFKTSAMFVTLCAIARALNVCQAERDRLEKLTRRQDDAGREGSKQLAETIMAECLAELGIDLQVPKMFYGFGQTKEQKLAHRKESMAAKKEFARIVSLLYDRVYNDPDVTDADREDMDGAVERFHKGTQVRKEHTHFEDFPNGWNMNRRFQELVDKTLADLPSMSDDEVREMIALNHVRVTGAEPVTATEWARNYWEKQAEKRREMGVAEWLAKRFRIGGSAHHNLRDREPESVRNGDVPAAGAGEAERVDEGMSMADAVAAVAKPAEKPAEDDGKPAEQEKPAEDDGKQAPAEAGDENEKED